MTMSKRCQKDVKERGWTEQMKDIQEAVNLYKQTSDEQVLKVLVRLLEVYASRELIGKQDHIEAKSDLNFVIYKSITNYDPSKNIKFITYFWRCYHGFVINSYVSNCAQKRNGGIKDLSLNNKMTDEFDGEEFGAFLCSRHNEVEEFLFEKSFDQILTYLHDSKDIYIIECLYKGFTVKEIAESLGFTRAYIHQRIRRLRNHPVGQELYALLKERIAEKTA
jgi:RNA polymerase sigma factor (sigma-70 family)